MMPQRVLLLGRRHVTLHVLVLLVHRAAGAGGRLRLGQGVVFLMLGAVDALLKDGLGLVDLELGLEVAQVVGVATAVGSAALVGPLELLINDFLTWIAPIASAAAILLGLLGVNTSEAVLGKELGNIVLRKNGAFGNASVVLLVVLVGASHFDEVVGAA